MSLSDRFATSIVKEVDGIPIQYGKNDDGTDITFIISRMGKSNKNYMKALERALRPYKRQIELKTIDNEVAGKVLQEVFIKYVLKDWQNVSLADITGVKTDTGYAPFNPVNATKLFDRLPDLFDELNTQANDMSNFRDATLEEDAKN